MGAVLSVVGNITRVVTAVTALVDAVKQAIKLFGAPASRAAPMPASETMRLAASTNPEMLTYASAPPEFWQKQRDEAHLQLGIDTIHGFNIGFCGKVNTGKSSLINAIRGIRRGESLWAPTGALETTATIQPYRFREPELNFTVLWDIPGCGTAKMPTASYFVLQKLFAFDFLLILCESYYGESEKCLAHEALNFGVPFAFVRSRFDLDLRAYCDEENIDIVTDDLKRNIALKEKTVFREKLDSRLKSANHFIVSAPVILDPMKNEKYAMEESELIRYIHQKISERRSAP